MLIRRFQPTPVRFESGCLLLSIRTTTLVDFVVWRCLQAIFLVQLRSAHMYLTLKSHILTNRVLFHLCKTAPARYRAGILVTGCGTMLCVVMVLWGTLWNRNLNYYKF